MGVEAIRSGRLLARRLTVGLVMLGAVAAGATLPSAEAATGAVGFSPTAVAPVLKPPALAGLKWYGTKVTVKGRHPVYTLRGWHDRIGVMWLDPTLLKFRFIPGPLEPEGSPMRPADRRPSTWVPRMAAAFNGGFRLGDGVGGYFYNGTMVQKMRNGYAALVVTKDGTLKVQVWGRDLKSTAGLLAIRQNLPPLVWQGKAQTKPTDNEATWGEADGGRWLAIRSALGMRADGSLVYVYGYNVRPLEMANAMVNLKVQTAVMLDMNQSWPMGFTYDPPVGKNPPVGHRVHPRVYREPSSYYEQFKKDFVVALVP